MVLAPELKEAIRKHACMEMGNGDAYLNLYQRARAEGWEGFSKRWKKDAVEERKHAQNWAKYLARRDEEAFLISTPVAEENDLTSSDIAGFAELAAMLEDQTEESMREVFAVAERVHDAAAAEWVADKLMDQEVEAKQARDFARRVRDAAGNLGALVIIDRKMEKGGW